MTVRSSVAQALTAGMGARPVAALADRIWSQRLRIVDFHGISDADGFDALMAFVADRYQPVSEDDVRAALDGGRPLPARAIWVTFDDGHPSVVHRGLPVLVRRGIPATFFICPGLVDDHKPPWWELVLAAGRAGVGATVEGEDLIGEQLVRRLKAVPDDLRRQVVAQVEGAGADDPEAVAWTLDKADLDRWLDSGNRLGNHTWDHPCLHRTDLEAQRSQITRADGWFHRYVPDHRPVFAYPNGDHTAAAQAVLAELGYPLALLSDHALAQIDRDPLQTSRLRLDAAAPLSRARAVLSGLHSAGYHRALPLGLTGPRRAGR